MSLVSRTVLSYLGLFCTLMPVLILLVQPTHAADQEIERRTLTPTVEESIKEAEKLLKTTSSQTFSFKDVYQINLNLDIPGDIEVVATEGEEIIVVLEKQMPATNTEHDITARAYLDSIAVTGIQGRRDSSVETAVARW